MNVIIFWYLEEEMNTDIEKITTITGFILGILTIVIAVAFCLIIAYLHIW
jgi:hypothetical protein